MAEILVFAIEKMQHFILSEHISGKFKNILFFLFFITANYFLHLKCSDAEA